MMKKLLAIVLLTLSLILVGCDTLDEEPSITLSTTTEDIDVEEIMSMDIDFEDGVYEDYTSDSYTIIDGSSSSYTITSEGTYVLTGTIQETIFVDLMEDEDVRLILNNVTIEASENAAIMVLSADDVIISIPEGTTSTLSDSVSYNESYADDDATIYSSADLVINGSGTLNVNANCNNAIQTKDDLMLVDVTINITSVDDGIIGRDSILVQNATINIISNGDGIKATNDESTDKGYIYIESGIFNINAGSDGFDAVNNIVIDDGTFDIVSGGEGIKSDANIYIADGNFTIDSVEDAIDSDGELAINGGTFDVSSDTDAIHSNLSVTLSNMDIVINALDDGIHSDTELYLLSGHITIENSYEGLEAKYIYIVDGSIDITSSDDGINASDPEITVVEGPFQAGSTTSTAQILMTGGTVIINSENDGVDANGSFTMQGGILIINGPTNGMQSAVDYDLTWTQTGGILIGVAGYGHETKAPSDTSTQMTLVYNTESIHDGETISILEDGEILYTFTPTKSYQAILISSPELNNTSTYSIAFNGDIDGTLENGYYTKVEVSNYDVYTTLTLSQTINTYNLDELSNEPLPPGRWPR
jgi:hypothetical protein